MLLIGCHGDCTPCGSDGGISLFCTSSINRGVGMWYSLYQWWLLLHDMLTANSYIIHNNRVFINNINSVANNTSILVKNIHIFINKTRLFVNKTTHL